MRRACVHPVGAASKARGISSGFYPHSVASTTRPVGEYTASCTFNQQVLRSLTHTQNSLFVSVSGSLIHTIHRTYNKPLQIKLNKLLLIAGE
jgi:hypothetical protein